jgi:hypothetical protein
VSRESVCLWTAVTMFPMGFMKQIPRACLVFVVLCEAGGLRPVPVSPWGLWQRHRLPRLPAVVCATTHLASSPDDLLKLT